MISTKGRYSIRILLDLAEHRGVGYTPIKDVAARQSISLKYVEKLMPALKNAGLLDSSHGIGGGYRLNRDPEQYDLWDINSRLLTACLFLYAPIFSPICYHILSNLTICNLRP